MGDRFTRAKSTTKRWRACSPVMLATAYARTASAKQGQRHKQDIKYRNRANLASMQQNLEEPHIDIPRGEENNKAPEKSLPKEYHGY